MLVDLDLDLLLELIAHALISEYHWLMTVHVNGLCIVRMEFRLRLPRWL